MKITYLYHSGFALEGDGYTLLIDYYKDTESEPGTGLVHDYFLKRPGKLYVLSTHSHPDHFNKEILDWKKLNPEIQYIFSSDILEEEKAEADDAIYLSKSEIYQDDVLLIKAYGSTDIGISFYIEVEGKQIFHAGDLNNWHWNEESTPKEIEQAENYFLSELNLLCKDVHSLDVAMFPIDSRLGKDYMMGGKEFLDAMPTQLFIPMHFGEKYAEAAVFETYALGKGCNFGRITHKGQSFSVD